MKLHERDWAAYVIRTKYSLARLTAVLEQAFGGKLKFLRNAGGAHTSGETDSASRKFEYRTVGHFFLLPDGMSSETFFSTPDHPKRIQLRRGEEYVYPGAALELLRHRQGGESDILLSCPYVALAREVWLSPRVFPGPVLKTFIRFDLRKLLSLMKTNDDFASRVQLRIARVDILGSSMLRTVRIAGNNVFDSYVYKWLFSAEGASAAREEHADGDRASDEGRGEWSVRLSEDAVRIHYHDDVGRGVAVYIDKHGNLRFRLGRSSSLLEAFRRFYLLCDRRSILVTDGRHPVRRAREEM